MFYWCNQQKLLIEIRMKVIGEVPEGSVVVPGSLPSKKPGGPHYIVQ